jgi:hypothetical protein
MKKNKKKAVLIIIGSINTKIKIAITMKVKGIILVDTPTFLPHEVHFVDVDGPKNIFLTKEIPG